MVNKLLNLKKVKSYVTGPTMNFFFFYYSLINMEDGFKNLHKQWLKGYSVSSISLEDQPIPRKNVTQRVSKIPRLRSLIPNLIFAFRCAVGTLITSVIIFLPGVTDFLSSQAKFFAIVIPALAVGKTVGGTLRVLVMGLPFIIVSMFIATFVSIGVQAKVPGWTAFLLFIMSIFVFAIEWGGTTIGGLGRKLSNGLVVTIILNAFLPVPPTRIGIQQTLSLVAGFACGYAGGLCASLLPPFTGVGRVKYNLRKASKSLSSLVRLLTDDMTSEVFGSPWFQEKVEYLLTRLESSTSTAFQSVADAQAEMPWCSFQNVISWVSFLRQARYQIKGVMISLRSRVIAHNWEDEEEDDSYHHYFLFRQAVHAEQQKLTNVMSEYFAAMANLQLNTPKKDLTSQFEHLKVVVLKERSKFMQYEMDVLKRGISSWPEEVAFDLMTLYFGLSSLATLTELIQQWSEPPPYEVSFQPAKGSISKMFDSWALNSSWDAIRSRLINASVLVISVVVASLFVVIPSLQARFSSGISASVVVIFIHQQTGFGSSLRASRERLCGIVLGGAYSYFAVAAFGSPVAITAAMVGWVFFSIVVFAQDSLYTAQSSIFAVSLALYNSGVNPDDSFLVISNYLVANCLSAVILLAVSSIFWLFSVLASRPSLVRSMHDILDLISTSVVLTVDRFTKYEEVPETKVDFPVPEMEAKLAQIQALALESAAEPALFIDVPNDYELHELMVLFQSSINLIRLLDSTTHNMLEHIQELRRDFGVLSDAMRITVTDCAHAMTECIQGCHELLHSIAAARREHLMRWLPLSVRTTKKQFLKQTLKAFRRTYKSETTLVGSRAIVRMTSAVFSFLQMCDKVILIFEHVFALVSIARNSKKLQGLW